MNFSTLLLLLVALVLLWLAVTNQLNRVLDAYDVLVGQKTASATSSPTAALTLPSGAGGAFRLPALPTLGALNQVPL